MDSIGLNIGIMLFWAFVVGLLAKRKNRNSIGWGIAGGFSWVIALLILAFMPYLCPKCQQKISNTDAKEGNCPNCKSANELGIGTTSSKGKPEDIYQNMASYMVTAALKYRLDVPTSDNKISADVGAEVIYLLLHMLDRQAFNELGVSQRDEVFDEVSKIVIDDYTKSILSTDAPNEMLVNSATQMMHALSERQLIYSQCDLLSGDGFPSKGTIVFALGFYINKALGNTDRTDVENILIGEGDLSIDDMKDIPDLPDIVDLAIKIVAAIKDSKIQENLELLK